APRRGRLLRAPVGPACAGQHPVRTLFQRGSFAEPAPVFPAGAASVSRVLRRPLAGRDAASRVVAGGLSGRLGAPPRAPLPPRARASRPPPSRALERLPARAVQNPRTVPGTQGARNYELRVTNYELNASSGRVHAAPESISIPSLIFVHHRLPFHS